MTLLLIILFFFSQSSVNAAETDSTIIMNEIQIEPQQVVELVNTTDFEVDISNWYLDDDGGTTYFTIPEDTQLPSQHCIVLTGNFNLNKSSEDTLRLFNSTALPTAVTAQLIDSFKYLRSPGTPITFQRIPDGGNWATASATLGSWNDGRGKCTTIPTPTPTPTATKTPPSPPSQQLSPTHTPSPTPAQLISNVYISEYYAAPKSAESEWVELYNNNDFQITLSDWYIDDEENVGASSKKFSVTIPAYDYGVIYLTSAMLNNSGDTVRLLDQDKREIEALSYGYTPMGSSRGWDVVLSAHYCLQSPTPGDQNRGCDIDNSAEVPITGEVQGTIAQPLVTPSVTIHYQSKSRYVIRAEIAEISNRQNVVSNLQNDSPPEYVSVPSMKSLYASPLSSFALLSICSIAAKIKLHI